MNKERTLNSCVWVNKINNNKRLIIKERNKEKNNSIQVKVRSEKDFLYLRRASIKIFVSRTRSPFNTC